MHAVLTIGVDTLDEAVASGAQALVVDVTAGAMPPRARVPGGLLLYLRSGDLEGDLPAMMASAPHGIVLPGCEGGGDVMRLGARLAVEEALLGLPDGTTRILPIVDTPRGVLALASLVGASPRLAGLTWDPGALGARIGAFKGSDRGGFPPSPLEAVRAAIRLAAAAAGVMAIDAACAAGGDLPAEIEAARRDGFSAKLARDPDQARAILMSARGGPAA